MEARIAFGRASRSLAGTLEADVEARTRAFFAEEVAPRIPRAARDVVELHRRAGEPVVLLSSTSPYLARAAAEHLALDAFLANAFIVEGGRFTGAMAEPLCFGEGKVFYAERWAGERGLDLDASAFYTDSITDLPMLERVGRPIAVGPDPRLGRVARQRGWPILEW